jgi:hypothetical protein
LPPMDDEQCPPPSSIPRIATFSEGETPSILHDPHVGIDFVLAYVLDLVFIVFKVLIHTSLERPCLPHLRESHLDHIVGGAKRNPFTPTTPRVMRSPHLSHCGSQLIHLEQIENLTRFLPVSSIAYCRVV